MVTALDSRLGGRKLEPRPFRFQATTLGKLFTHTHTRDSVTKQYKLVLVKRRGRPAAGRVTAGTSAND